MSKAFHYQRLGASEIRLFRIIHTVHLDQAIDLKLEGRLENFGDKRPSYTALSYMWGSPERTQSLFVGRDVLYITRSLEVFLQEVLQWQRDKAAGAHVETSQKNVSLEWMSGWLWIDAVCINQDDVEERNQQVRMMRRIYDEATNMIIWLGEGNEDTMDAFETLESIAGLEVEDDEQGGEFKLIDGEMSGITCKIDNGISQVEILYMALDEIGSLLRNTYWNRAWVIQEASTPKHSAKTMVCTTNGCSMSWADYAAANRCLLLASWNNRVAEHINLDGIAGPDIAAIQHIQDWRSLRRHRDSIYTLLVRFRTAGATDARDKVYALLGMSAEADISEFAPDYTMQSEEVYSKTARAIISQTSSLDCIGSAGLLHDLKLPSWVPDWTVMHDVVPQPFYQNEQIWTRDGTLKERRNLFNASRGLNPDVKFARDGRQLIAKGFKAEVIVAVSWVRRHRGGADLDATWSDWVKTGQVEDSRPYESGCSRIEAFLKTINADIHSVRGDWSAERGFVVDRMLDISTSRFAAGEPILDAMTSNRRLVGTEKGLIGLAPSTTEIGDVICILAGSQMPIVLRQEGQHWLCVGQAYVHGIMDGEAVFRMDEHQLETFAIV